MAGHTLPHFDSAESYIRQDWLQIDRHYREQIEDGYRPSLRVPYKATDWSKTTKAEERDLMGGFDERHGYCSTCHLILTASGACSGWCE